MAYDFMNQAMGFGPNAFETEEERRRREEQEAAARGESITPFKQTITTDPVTGKQTMKMEGDVRDFTSANPNTPTVVAPVSPDQDYINRIRQVESGNRDYTPTGAPVTSPKGAMYASQVMPSTAANPGFGIRPAADQSPEEYNRVGQEYALAMRNRYPGQPEAAAAAYNMGPGAVDRNIAQNQGRFNLGQAPTETQGFVPRVLGQVLNAVVPSAQAETLPGAPAPTATPGFVPGGGTGGLEQTPQGVSPETRPLSMAARAALERQQPQVATTAPTAEGLSMGPPMSAAPEEAWVSKLEQSKADPRALAALNSDTRAPDWIRSIAAEELGNNIVRQRQTETARKDIKEIAQNNGRGLEKRLRDPSEEGSIFRAVWYELLGMNDLAKAEQQKIGNIGNMWSQTQLNGQQVAVEFAPDGRALRGINTVTGQPISESDINRLHGQGGGPLTSHTMPSAHGGPVTKNGEMGLLMYDPRSRQSYVQVGNRKEAPQGWVTMSQDPNAVYNKSVSQTQGTQAGQGYVNQPAPAGPLIQGQPGVAGGQPGVAGGAVNQPAAVVQTNPNIPSAGPAATTEPVWKQKQTGEIAGKRTEAFNKIIDTEYREGAAKGEIVSNNRKEQFAILDRVDPASGKKMGQIITGIYNADNEHPGDQKWTMVRDILTSKVALPEDEVSKRIARLNLSPEAKSALTEYVALNAQIASQTLKETAGAGSVSDAEQQANRARNVDIGKTPMLGTYNMMAQSQFHADIQRYKADLAASENNKAASATQFDREFRKTQAELTKTYREIAEKRIDYMRQNGFTPDAIREGYIKYPVPEYDPSTGQWKKLKPLAEIMK